jgi:flagellar biosynthesis protein
MSVRKSVALSWTGSEIAPVIVANGKEELALRMLAIARDCGVQIVTDPLLADILSDTDIGTCIPQETWQAVAAIFAFLERGLDENLF